MGHEKVTIKNLQVLQITNDGLLLIKGLVPGGKNTLVVVKKVGESKKFVPLFKSENSEELSKPEESDTQKVSVSESVQEEVKAVEETTQENPKEEEKENASQS